jgi:hypothetical protein
MQLGLAAFFETSRFALCVVTVSALTCLACGHETCHEPDVNSGRDVSVANSPGVTLRNVINVTSSVVTAEIRERMTERVGAVILPTLEVFDDEDARLFSQALGEVYVGSARGLSLCAANHLGRHRGRLTVRRMRSITEAAAAALEQHLGDLHLPEVSNLSESAIEHLSRVRGALTLGIESLTLPGARALGQAHSGLSLPRLRHIDTPSAEALQGIRGPLNLGLAGMSPAVAKVFATRVGPLTFDADSPDVRCHLSPAVARELALYRGDLTFRLKPDDLMCEALAALAMHKGKLTLFLDGPLSLPAAQALSDHAGPLVLSFPPPMTREVAGALARHKSALDVGFRVCASGEVIQELARHQGTELRLRLAIPLDEKTATLLAAYRGRLIFPLDVSKPVAASRVAVEALANHRGWLSIPSSMVSGDTAGALSRHSGGLHISFPLSECPTVEVIEKLGACDGCLGVDAILSAECVRVLAARRGDLVLGQVPQSSEECNVLINRRGKVLCAGNSTVSSVASARLIASGNVPEGISTTRCLISPEAVSIASELAKRKGRLSLPFLRYLTADALRALVQKNDVELLPLDQLYVFDKDECVVPAEDVVPESFREFNRTHQPPRSRDLQRGWYEP